VPLLQSFADWSFFRSLLEVFLAVYELRDATQTPADLRYIVNLPWVKKSERKDRMKSDARTYAALRKRLFRH
jgi:hypothetical protein